MWINPAKKYKDQPCPICGDMFYPRRGTKKTCSRRCGSALLSQRAYENEIHWKYNHDGYLVAGFTRNGVRVSLMQHRFIMESHIGRSLRQDEVVHHKNGVRDDNRLENLEIQNRSEHASEHGRMRKGYGGWTQNLTVRQRKELSDRAKRVQFWKYSHGRKKGKSCQKI